MKNHSDTTANVHFLDTYLAVLYGEADELRKRLRAIQASISAVESEKTKLMLNTRPEHGGSDDA